MAQGYLQQRCGERESDAEHGDQQRALRVAQGPGGGDHLQAADHRQSADCLDKIGQAEQAQSEAIRCGNRAVHDALLRCTRTPDLVMRSGAGFMQREWGCR